MVEEIKEILDNLYRYKDEDYMKYQPEDILTIEDVWLLYDYITNLQQENEFLKLNNPEMNIEHFRIVKENKRKIDNLRKENKRLKEDNLLIESANKLVSDNLHNYKSRCEKAIEYIKNNKKETSSHFNGKEYVYRNFTLCCEPNDLLDILNGSDEK